MDGPAESRLRRHLELTRDYINKYKKQKNKRVAPVPDYLASAEFHMLCAEEIYEVIYE